MRNELKKALEQVAKARRIPTEGLSDIELFQRVTGINAATEEFIDEVEFPDWYVPGGIVRQETKDDSTTETDDIENAIGTKDPDEIAKYDKDGDGTITENDVKAQSYIETFEEPVTVTSAADLSAIETPAEADVIVTNEESMKALTAGTTYKTLTLVGGKLDSTTVKLNANEKLTLDGVEISGENGATNGKVNYSAPEVEFKNIKVENGSTVYNVFEGSQVTNDPNYTGLEKMTVENVEIDNPSLTHNVVNVYTPANDAVITIKDSKFNLTVDTSNALRLSNYLNSDNVTVNFENVEWTYENGVTADDWRWAGLVIYQPAGKDVALTGDLTHINTWTFNFKNCKYNGVKVTANNFGEHNQVGYTYNVNKSNAVADLSEAATFNFA